MATVFPPSPAPSASDSLADIEDLDAFLDAQGQLSHWPTPPPAESKDSAVVTAYEYDSADSDDEDDGDDELWRIAASLTEIASVESKASDVDVELVLRILIRADVPPEVLALAFNILRTVASSARQLVSSEGVSSPDLNIAACLSLATTFTSDKPPGADHWARHACRGTWTAQRIDATVLQFLTLHDVRLLELSSPAAIDAALHELCVIAQCPSGDLDHEDKDIEPQKSENADVTELDSPAPPLTISTSNSSAQWAHGAWTPAETPEVEQTFFLPLL